MSRQIDAWGNSHRHYAEPVTEVPLTRYERWENVIEQYKPHYRSTVERTVNLWNQKIRHQLMSEIGFQLKGRSVRVKIDNGLPAPLHDILRNHNGLEILILNQSLIRGVVSGTEFMDSSWHQISRFIEYDSDQASRSDIVRVGKTAHSLLNLIQQLDLVQNFRQIDEDVLGAYFPQKSEVKIYWIAIGIVSALLEVPIEELTFVVLSHELAHAYTHLGFDIDGFDWPTEHFNSTDVAIIEGLAQFYTEVICTNLRSQIPGVQTTFSSLLEHQNEIYSTHRDWVREDDRNNGEIIRVSLLECRRSGRLMDRLDFANVVKQRRREIAGTHHSGNA